ncbi:MAG: hypothetical protein WAM28_00080, partial [Chlamydiales bacterium]
KENRIICPLDRHKVSFLTCIPFKELRDRIALWNKERGLFSSLSDDKEVEDLTSGMRHLNMESDHRKRELPSQVVRYAHRDDIHAMALLPNTFVTGSKDTTIKQWTLDAKFIKAVQSSSHKGYSGWITALCSLNKGLWVSGTRDGVIKVWNQEGNEIQKIQYNPDELTISQYVCKHRNQKRINCIADAHFGEENSHIYTGTPRYVQLWNLTDHKIVREYIAHPNNWVYGLQQLNDNRWGIIIGPNLEVWKMENLDDPYRTSIISAQKGVGQPPHISSMTLLKGDSSLIALTSFDASVKIIDIETKKCIQNYQEHSGRVWSVVSPSRSLLISGADDKTARIWDARQCQSVITLEGHPGRVSSILVLYDNFCVTASCPDYPSSQNQAILRLWDLRNFIESRE